jgi:hypothetical protein
LTGFYARAAGKDRAFASGLTTRKRIIRAIVLRGQKNYLAELKPVYEWTLRRRIGSRLEEKDS